jgi:uncharacterized protein
MRIVVTGGTGFIGRALVQDLAQRGHKIIVLTRHPASAQSQLPDGVACVGWNPPEPGAWQERFQEAEAVINLAGEPIAAKRWSAARKEFLRESRTNATRSLVEALRTYTTRPRVFVNASGVGYYGPRNDMSISETAGAGCDYLADLCIEWEREARRAEELGMRVVRIRFGMVLGRDGGALPKIALPFRLFIGGPIMPGTQWVSWLHLTDAVGLIRWILDKPDIAGAINAVAPEPVTMRQFCGTLAKVLHRPSWLPVPAFALRVGLGELGAVMTTGQRVLPQAALRGGYRFQHPSLEPALRAIFAR